MSFSCNSHSCHLFKDQARKAKMAPRLSSNNTGFCKYSCSDSISSPSLEQACHVQVQGTPNGLLRRDPSTIPRLTTPRKPSSCWHESHSGDSTHATFWLAFSKPRKICHNIWNFGWIGNLGCASSIQKRSPIGDSCAKLAGAKIQPLKLQYLSAKPH